MEERMEGSAVLLAENPVNESTRDSKQEDFSVGEKPEKTSELDLELAAEIGKVLLEKNRELELLLRSSQEYTEEQILRAQFFEQQLEYLRDSLQSQTKTCEHLELQNHELTDQNTQLKNDYRAANSKSKRLWDTIESLEKKCENYRYTIDVLEDEKLKFIENEKREKEMQLKEERKIISSGSKEFHKHEDYDDINDEFCCLKIQAEFEDKAKNLQETIRDMRVQQNLDQIEKEELKSELEDISTENQLLQHRLSILETEVEEWQKFANKAQRYKKLADQYCSNIEITRYSSTSQLLNSTEARVYDMTKSCSHEVLTNNQLCDPSELLATKRHISASVSQLNKPVKNLSVLSEMDNQYHDLVKRYEQLLDKYDNRTANLRTEKVQRAIQTLSWDFSHIDVQTKPCSPERRTSEKEFKFFQVDEDEEESQLDFRNMFVEIFAKLKSTKEFDPEVNNDSK